MLTCGDRKSALANQLSDGNGWQSSPRIHRTASARPQTKLGRSGSHGKDSPHLQKEIRRLKERLHEERQLRLTVSPSIATVITECFVQVLLFRRKFVALSSTTIPVQSWPAPCANGRGFCSLHGFGLCLTLRSCAFFQATVPLRDQIAKLMVLLRTNGGQATGAPKAIVHEEKSANEGEESVEGASRTGENDDETETF